MPTINDLLERKGREVVSVGPDETVYRAVEILIEKKIGSVVVRDAENEILGILTERDVLRVAYDQPERIKTAKVSEFMTKDLVCGVPEDDLDYVMDMMTRNRFRRRPVMQDGKLVGLLSIGDVVKALKSAHEYENRQLQSYIAGGYS